jgi:hypothetical protein
LRSDPASAGFLFLAPARTLRRVTILHFHSRTLLLMSRDAALRARADADRPNALTSDSISAILLAAAATEGFVNELAELVLAHCDSPALAQHVLPPIAAAARIVKEIENERKPLRDKYFQATKAFGSELDRGSRVFQEFDRLHNLRDAIMHTRPALDDRHLGRRQTNVLATRGIAMTEEEFSGSWFDRLMVPSAAKWAHDSARDIMRAFFERMPVRAHYDPFEMYRSLLITHPECW